MGDDRPIRYLDPDGTVVYRASGLGACDGVILGLGAGRVPRDPPEWLLEVFAEGNRAEPAILSAVRDAMESDHDTRTLEVQGELTLEIGEINDRRVVVRGHVDGWNPEYEVLVEAKKFRPSTWDKFLSQKIECNPLYPWQASAYMWALAMDGFAPTLIFAGGRWEDDQVREVVQFRYPDPPIPLKAIRKRIARWENLIASGMDVTDLTDKCSPSMFPCPMFGKGCPSEATVEEVLELTGDIRFAAEALAEQIDVQAGIAKTARTMGDAADKKRKELYEGLRAIHQALVDEGKPVPKKMRAGEFVITHVTGHVPEKVTKPYDLDYFTIKKEGA